MSKILKTLIVNTSSRGNYYNSLKIWKLGKIAIEFNLTVYNF